MGIGINFESLKTQDEQKEKLNKALESCYLDLEENGYIEKKDDGQVVCDIEKLKNVKMKDFMSENKHISSFHESVNFGKRNYSRTLFLMFKKLKVISREDYKNKEREERDLLYSPDSKEEALNIEKIKKSKFYLSLYELNKSPKYSKTQYGEIDDLDMREVILPMIIYHPEYLDGYRDEQGKLLIKDEAGERRKISANYLIQKYGNFGTVQEKGKSLSSGRLFVRNVLPKLVDKGLLLPSDFDIGSGGSTEEIMRQDKTIRSRGQVMFNGVAHILGAVYEGKQAYEINDSLGGIVDVDENGNKKLVATFNIISRGDIKESEAGYYLAGVAVTKAEKIDNFKDLKKGEDVDEYEGRIKKVEGFELFLKTAEYIKNNLGIDLEKFSQKEQEMISKMVASVNILEKKKFEEFVLKFKDKGLKSFLSLEFDQKMGDKIFLIGEKLETEDADLIFAQYARIVDLTENVRQELEKQFANREVSDEEKQKISENILVKAGCLLTVFADRLKKGEELSSDDIVHELENFNEDLLFTFSVFKGLEGVNLEDLKGVSLERVSIERYSEIKDEILQISRGEYELKEDDSETIKEVYEMFELYKKNYANREDLQKELLEGFAKILIESEETHLYIVKQNNRVVAFNRYDKKRDNRKYFGSCNVMPSIQALAIGGVVFKESIKQESPSYNIEMTADAFSSISSLYIEKGNFHVQKVDTDSDPDGIPWFILERIEDKKRQSYFENKNLLETYEKQDKDIDTLKTSARFVLEFDKSEEQQNFITNLVNEENFKITRSYFDKGSKKTYFGFEKKQK